MEALLHLTVFACCCLRRERYARCSTRHTIRASLNTHFGASSPMHGDILAWFGSRALLVVTLAFSVRVAGMGRPQWWLSTAISILSVSGCATTFVGSAHIEDGRAGCEQKCAGEGLAMSALVYMGEYSSACVCTAPGAKRAAVDASANLAAGVAGVTMQMRQQEERRRRSMQEERRRRSMQ